jgi:hypothetical protein
MPKKDLVIKNGTYCERCKGKGRAISTSRTRDRKRQLLLELAAEFLPQYSDKKRDCGQSEWIADQMNRRLRPEDRITKKWVTQNRKKIEETAEASAEKVLIKKAAPKAAATAAVLSTRVRRGGLPTTAS